MDLYRNIDRTRFIFDFVVYDDDEQYFESEIELLGGRIHRVPQPRAGILTHLRAVDSLLKERQYDVVHSHTAHHSGLISLVAWANRIPVRIAHARNSGGSASKSAPSRIYRVGSSWLMNAFATHRVAVSGASSTFMFGNSTRSIHLPNAIDVNHYLAPRASDELRTRNGVPPQAIVLGQIGRLAPVKNHEFTIRLLEDLLKKNPNYFLVIVGEGPDKTQLEQLAEQGGIRNRVLFTGLQADVADWLATFDVTLMPSHREGLGNVVLESQAMGVPVLASTGVPAEVDMGLSLVRFLPLDAARSVWIEAIESSLKLSKPDDQTIHEAFERQGYVLEAVLKKLEQLYLDRGRSLS